MHYVIYFTQRILHTLANTLQCDVIMMMSFYIHTTVNLNINVLYESGGL